MRIEHLSIRNFLSISKIDVSLDNKGLVLIQGENRDDTSQDSNGSGKSSFPDAISWVLYGVTARGVSGAAVINSNTTGACRVEIQLIDEEDLYSIIRIRTKSSSSLIIARNGVDETLATIQLNQERINSIIGCSADVFNAAIYSAQDGMVELPSLTDKALKSLIEEAAGVDRLQRAHELALEKKKGIDLVLTGIQADLHTQEKLLEAAKYNEAQTKSDIKDWDSFRERVIRDIKEEAETVAEEIKGLKKQDVEAYIVEVKNLENAAAELSVDRLKQEIDLEHKIARILIEIDNLKRQARNSELRQNRINSDLLHPDIPVGEACDECGKEYTGDDLDHYTNGLNEELKNEENEASKLFAEIAELLNESVRLEKEKKAAGIVSTEEVKIKDRIIILNKLTEEGNKANKERNSLIDRYTELERKYKEEKARENPHLPTLDRAETVVALHRDSVEEYKNDELEAGHELKVATSVSKVFSREGVRSYILDMVTPFLNSRTSEYLTTLTDGNISAVWSTLATTKAGELREKFNIEVKSKLGAESYKALSGGERRKVKLSCAMALQDLVASRATKPLGIYIADEIDDALDDQGLERLMGILDQKAKEKGTLLVISHNSLSDWIRQTATIVKEGGSSTIEGSCLDLR